MRDIFAVMRRTTGGKILPFNGQNGERPAPIRKACDRDGPPRRADRTLPHADPRGLWPKFAPLIEAWTDFPVDQATHAEAPAAMAIRRPRLGGWL